MVVALLSACASTTLVNEWHNPSSSGTSFHRVVVLGVTSEEGLRRTFEDEFVAQLKAAGVDAVPSYQYLPQEREPGEEKIRGAVQEAGADAVLITRLVTVAPRTQYSSVLYASPAFGFRHRCCVGWAGYSTVYQYEVYVAETNLYDGARNELAWSGMTQTTAPGKVRKEMQEFAGLIIESLKKQRLI
jgi:hypothetical protein